MSYGLTVQALTDFLPLEVTLDIQTVRHDSLKVAQRCEDDLGEEQWAFIEGCPADWGPLPIPDGPITIGIDGGYVRDWEAKQRNFEVIVGKSTLALRDEEADVPSSKCFGFVQTFDTKRKRRLFEVLLSGQPRVRRCLVCGALLQGVQGSLAESFPFHRDRRPRREKCWILEQAYPVFRPRQ